LPELRVVIVDSNENFSRSAKNYLANKKKIDNVDVVSSCSELISALSIIKPDLLLIDKSVVLAESKIQTAIYEFKKKRPEAKVLLMTLYPVTKQAEYRSIIKNITGVITKQDFATEIQQYLCYVKRKVQGV